MVVVLVVMLTVVVSGIPGGPSLPLLGGHPELIKVQLKDADALAPKAGVQIAGVKIGEVRNVESQGGVALVTMAIDPQYGDIHTDAQIKLRPHGLFGPKFIEVSPGTAAAPLLHDGDTIPGEQTALPVDLDQVLHELQAPERVQLQTAIVQLGEAAAGRGVDFNHLVGAGSTLTKVLDAPIKTLNNVAPNLSDYIVQNEAFNASFSQAPLDQLVANNNKVLAAFAANTDHLASLLDHADSVLTTLDAALNGQSGNIRGFLEVAPSTIDKLNRFNDLLGLFAANFTGKEAGVPDITQGLIAAIENPRSATSSWDPCTVGPGCPDGKSYYFKVESFSAPPSQPSLTPVCDTLQITSLPVIGGTIGGVLQCPAAHGASKGPTSAAGLAGYTGGGLISLGEMLSP
jgi:phospholipid/cholesterol/gamma-HCH transport system substrate-binding protein